MAQEKPLQTLYQSLKSNNYDVPDTYESFERTLTLPGQDGMNNRHALYQALRDDNYDVPDTYESFANTLFSPAKKENPVQAAEDIKTGGNASETYNTSLPTWNDVKNSGLNFGGSNPYMVQKPLITQPRLQNPANVDTGFKTIVDKDGNYVGSKFVGQEGTPVQKFVEYQDKKAEEERNRPFGQRVSSVFDQYSSGDEAEQVWNEAETQSNKELMGYLERRNKPTFGNLMRDLATGSNITGGAGVDATEMGMEAFASHLKYHDLQKMSDAAWNRMDDEKKYSIVTDIYRKLQEYNPDADKDALMSDAMKIARQESDRRVYDLAVQKNTPKDALDLFFRKAALGTSIGDLMMAGARAKAGTIGDLAAREQAEQEYEKEHKLAGVAGTIAGFALDPLVYAGGAIGGAGARGVLAIGGKMFGQAAARKFGTTLGGRLLSGAIGGGLNFGTYEAGREATGQLKWGGYRNPKTGEIEDYSLGEVGKKFAHGLGMGAVTGTISPLLGNISDKLVRATQSTAEKMAYRAGELGVGTVAEGTIFSVPEAIQTYSDYEELINSLSDENSPNYIADDAERAAKIQELTSSRNDAILDVWTDNMIMMAGFKANHLLKSAPRVIEELSKNPTRTKAGFETRLRKMLDGQEGLALTKNEARELREGGYDDLSSLVESYVEYSKNPQRAINEKENTIIPYREGIPYNRFVELMNDQSISEAARAKMYYYLTGHVLPMSTIYGVNFKENKDSDGNITGYTVESFGNNGVVTSRTFDSKDKANVELDNVKRQIELNTIEVGEKYYKYGDKSMYQRKMANAINSVAEEYGYSPDVVRDLLNEKKPETLTERQREIVDAVQKAYGKMGEESLTNMRDGINEKYGVDVDKAIGKEPQRRNEQERKAVNEYVNTLYTLMERGQQNEQKAAEMAQLIDHEIRQSAEAEHTPKDVHEGAIDEAEAGERLMQLDPTGAMKRFVDQMIEEGTSVEDVAEIMRGAGDSEEKVQAANDYIAAKAKNKGINIQTENNVQSAVNVERERISQFVYDDEGVSFLIPVTYSGRTGYVVGFDGENAVIKFEDDGSEKMVLMSDEDLVRENNMTLDDYMAAYAERAQNDIAGAVENARVNNPRTKVEPVVGDVIDTVDGQKRVAAVKEDGSIYLEEPLEELDKESGQMVPKHPSEFSPENIVTPEEFVRKQNEFYDDEDRAAREAEKEAENVMRQSEMDNQTKLEQIAAHTGFKNAQEMLESLKGKNLKEWIDNNFEPSQRTEVLRAFLSVPRKEVRQTKESVTDTQDVEQPQPVEEDNNAMPMVEVKDKKSGEVKQKPDFSKAGAERSYDYIYNERGLERNDANDFVNNNLEAAQKRLENLKSKPVKMGTDLDEFAERKAKWQADVDAAQKDVDLWQGIKGLAKDEMLEQQREEAEVAKANKKVSELGEPLSLREWIMRALYNGGYKFDWNDDGSTKGLGSHLGFSNSKIEKKKRRWMLDKRENGALSPEMMAERMLNAYATDMGWEGTEGDWNIDSQDVLNELLDIVASNDRKSEMGKKIVAEHNEAESTVQTADGEEVISKDEEEYLKETFAKDMGFNTYDEWENYVDMISDSVEPMTKEEYEENIKNVAEEYEKESVSLQQNEQLNTENNGEENLQPTDARIQGGTEVLSGEQVPDTGRSEGSLGDGQGVSTSEYGEGSGDLQKEEGTGTGVTYDYNVGDEFEIVDDYGELDKVKVVAVNGDDVVIIDDKWAKTELTIPRQELDALRRKADAKQEKTNKKTIQGLENYEPDEVLNAIRGEIEMRLDDAGLDGVTIKDMALNGSRMRGDARDDSDLDVVVEYEGDISEDGLFNILNENPIEIEGIRVDVNPITKYKSGTLEEYMKRSAAYDEERMESSRNEMYERLDALSTEELLKIAKEKEEKAEDLDKIFDEDKEYDMIGYILNERGKQLPQFEPKSEPLSETDPLKRAEQVEAEKGDEVAAQPQQTETAVDFENETMEEWQAFEKRVPQMSDEELLQYMEAQDEDMAYHSSVFDEYDARHRDEYLGGVDFYKNELDKMFENVYRGNQGEVDNVLERMNDMQASVLQKWDDGGYCSPERTALLAQLDAINEWIDEFMNREQEPLNEYNPIERAEQVVEREKTAAAANKIKENGVLKPGVDVERSRKLRQDLADAYASGDKKVIKKAIDAIKVYRDEGFDFEQNYNEEIDDYEGDNPMMLADKYIIHAYQDAFLDDDEDQEYIKTGLTKKMRGENISNDAYGNIRSLMEELIPAERDWTQSILSDKKSEDAWKQYDAAKKKLDNALKKLSDEQLRGLEDAFSEDYAGVLSDRVEAEERRRAKVGEVEKSFTEGLAEQGKVTGKAKEPKSDLDGFTDKRELRPAMNGVYYDPDGYAVASDGKVLIADKTQFDKKNSGKIVLSHKLGDHKKGDVLTNGNYPKWKLVIPSKEGMDSASVSFSDIRNFLAGAEEKLKAQWNKNKEDGTKTGSFKDWSKDAVVGVRMPNGEICVYNYPMLRQFTDAAQRMGMKEVYYGAERPLYAENRKGVLLLMPTMPDAISESIYNGKAFYEWRGKASSPKVYNAEQEGSDKVSEPKAKSLLNNQYQLELFSDKDFEDSVWDEFQKKNEYDSIIYSQILERRNTSLEEAKEIRDKIVERFKQNPSAQERKRMIAQLEAVNPYIEFVERELQELENDKKREVKEPTQIRLRPLAEGETSHVERRYEENGFFDFTGSEKIESIDDVAYIFRQLQNAAVENAFIVLVKDGVPTVIHVGMGSYLWTMFAGEQAFVAFREINPDKVYMVHNHPSGKLISSRVDRELYAKMKGMFGNRLREGIIIDTTSGKYGTFGELYDNGEFPIVGKGDSPVKTYTFSKNVFAPDWNPETAFKSNSAADIAKFISSHRLGEHEKMSLLVVTNNLNIAGNVFLPWTSLKEAATKEGADLIAYYMNQMGGTSVIVYGNTRGKGDVEASKKLKSLLESRKTRLIDVVRVAEYNPSDYDSMAEQGLMESSVEYGTTTEYKEYEREQDTIDKRGGLIKNEPAERSLSRTWRGTLHVFGRNIGRRIAVLSGEDIRRRYGNGVRGFYDPLENTLYLNEDYVKDNENLRSFILGHEVTHILRMENSEVWDAYVNTVKLAMGDDFQKEFDKKRNLYDTFVDRYNATHTKKMKKLSDSKIEEEVCADWAGRNVLTDEEAVKQIIDNAAEAGADPVSLTQKILDTIKQWLAQLKQALKSAVGNKKEILDNIKFAEQAKKLWQDMYNVAVARQNAKMESLDEYDPVRRANQIENRKAENKERFSLDDDKTLMGVHNISEDKLRKALKLGGLANPSMAVIDTSNYTHTDYGDISLIPRSSLIDAKTGRNAGTFTADAWTPSYPQVIERPSNKGLDKFYDDMRKMKNEDGIASDVVSRLRMAFDSFLDGREPAGMYWWYMKDRGMNPKITRWENPYGKEVTDKVSELTNDGSADLRELPEDVVKQLVSMYQEDARKSGGATVPAEKQIAILQQKISEGGDLMRRFGRMWKLRLDDLQKYGESITSVRAFVDKVMGAKRRDGSFDEYTTFDGARKEVRDSGRESDYLVWLDELRERYGIESYVFDGYTPSGNQKWVKNTLTNVSKMMKKEGLNGATGISGIGNWIARVAKKVKTLDQIRKEKRNLQTTKEEHDAFRDKWADVLYDIANRISAGDNYSGDARLSEALDHADPAAYIKREYGKELSKEDKAALEAFIKDVKENFPTGYFETKFERPVTLDEFAVAVIPENTSTDVVDALKNAGLDVRTYNNQGTEEENNQNRRAAVMDAVESRDDIMFSLDDNEPFYSNAEKAVRDIKQEKATPEQWLKMIEKNGGLKAGEDKWLGLSEWLKNSDAKTLTKLDVLGYIVENEISVEDVNYSSGADWETSPKMIELRDEFDQIAEEKKQEMEDLGILSAAFDEEMTEKYGYGWKDKLEGEDKKRDAEFEKRWKNLGGDPYRAAFREMVNRHGDDFEQAFEADGGILNPVFDYYEDDLSEAARYYLDMDEEPINETRLSYTTEGLDNKKEIALVVPSIEPWNQSDQIHFGDAGGGRAVAWVRFGDTTIPVTEKVYKSAEELQEPLSNGRGSILYYPKGMKPFWSKDYIVRFKDKDGNDKYSVIINDAGFGVFDTLEEAQENMNFVYQNHPKEKVVGRQKVLVIDEIQSKRHQEGREKGYKKDIPANEPTKLKHEAAKDAVDDYLTALRKKYGRDDVSYGLTEEERGKLDKLHDEEIAARLDYNKYLQENKLGAFDESGIPDAPFDKNWHELAMKRMLRYAAENGYDKVAWTKGAQQAERYSLGHVLYQVTSEPYKAQSPTESDGHDLMVNMQDGTMYEMFVQPDGTLNADSGLFDGKNIADVFGKSLADKIMSATERTEIKDEELRRIGAEGMRGFYDQILPRFMDKYGKKWGVKTGEINLPDIGDQTYKMNADGKMKKGLTMWSVDVTPDMKESVMQGQPMFSLADEPLDEYNPVRRAEQIEEREKKQRVEKVRARFNELNRKYNGVDFDAIVLDELSDDELIDVLGVKGEEREEIKNDIDKVRKHFSNPKRLAVFNPFTGRIIIFADRIKQGKEDEAYFHENIHKILEDWYGDGLRSIAERFWDVAPDEGLVSRQHIIDKYKPEDRKEDLFVFWLSRAMANGDVEIVLDMLNDEDKMRVNNILNILGYDRQAEEINRRKENDREGISQQPQQVQQGGVLHGRRESDEDGEVMFSLDEESSEKKKPTVKDTDYNEFLTKARLDNAQKNKDDVDARIRAMKAISGNLSQLRRAMSIQRDYDRKTVDRIVKLARMVMDTGFIDELSRGEVKKLLGLVNGAAGKEDISMSAKKVVDMLVDHQLRECESLFAKQLSTKAKKLDAKGVEIQGKLDIEGQRMLSALKDGIKMRDKELEQRIAEAEDDLDSENAVVRKNAAIELQGLMLAKQYQESILASEEEERELKKDLRKFREQFYDYETEEYEDEKGKTRKREVHHVKPEYKRNPRVQDAIRQFEDEYDVNLSENHVQRIKDYFKLLSAVGGNISESIERAKEWIESEKKRVNEIHHHANSDLEGISARSQTKEKTKGLSTNPIVRAILSPMASFEKMMRFFGRKSPNGEGYLFDDFVRGQLWASDKEWRSKQEALKELGEKAKELFGGKFEKVTDLYKLNNNLPTVPVEYWDEGERVEDEISQLEALYLYMANKMKDGKMKLRAMGISEEDIETIKNHIDPRLIQFADWVQSEFLPKKREYYNEVYNRLNGADMAAIDEYFPLKIQQGSISKSDDITEKGRDKKASTMVGSYIKRTKNAKPLDIHSNAISVLMEHIDDMEHISAWGEFNRDLNTLINYKRFENRVKNMDSVEFGTGKQLWNDLVKAAQVVTNSYSSNIGKIDRAVLNIAKGATSAAIVGRVWTAIKQLSSIPAWWNREASVQELAKATKDIVKTWKWGMENLPTFSKRWESRKVGEIRLEDSEDDYSIWKNKAISWLNRSGMKPNAFFDALACVAGAKAVYETKKKRYLDYGYSADKADKKALEDAAIAFNNSQQSAESVYLAPVQKDRSVASVMTTVFRTSPIGYTRRLFSSLRKLRNMSKKGYKEESIEYLKKKMVREGLSEEQAEQAANKEYSRARNKAIADVALFGYLLPFAWNLFKVAPYLFMGDDDDKKLQYFEDAAVQALLFGPIEGLAGGNILSELGINIYHALRHDESLMSALTNDYAELPVFSEAKRVIRSFNKDVVAGAVDLVSLLTQVFVGANPKVIIDGLAAILDYAQGDMWTAREIALLLMKIAQVPQSQLDEIYIDEIGMSAREAQHLRIEEVAKRYINYKENRETAFLSNVYPEDYKKEVDDKWMGKVKNSLKARLLLQSDADIEKGLIQASPGMEQDIYEKELLRRIDVNVEGYSPAELAEAYNNAELQPVRKRLAKEISKDAGASKDPYGDEPGEDYERYYQDLRTAKDVQDDATLLAEQQKARDAGDEQRKNAISKARSRVMSLRKGLGLGNDKDVMKTLREERYKLLEDYVYKINK